MKSKLHECQRVNPPGIRITCNIAHTTHLCYFSIKRA